MKTRPLRLGLSICFDHADPTRAIFKGKVLQYVESCAVSLFLSRGVLAYPIPSPMVARGIDLETIVRDLDGVVIPGGADVAPEAYGESPLQPSWAGDSVRDAYELDLIACCVRLNKPLFGICRGLQLLNVAFGGSLYQDIATQCPGSLTHRNWEVYDQNKHTVRVEPESHLASLYNPAQSWTVNSIHHQCIKELAPRFVVEALSEEDRIIEAIRLPQSSPDDPYVAAVQWHPEFHIEGDGLMDPEPLVQDFLRAVHHRTFGSS